MGALAAAGWGGLGASALLIGAWLALRFDLRHRTTGLVLGFGAGALIAAIAYELIPEGEVTGWQFLAFGIGALVFYVADRLVGNGSDASSIALGALLDGVPESLVLGMSLATGGEVSIAFLAAVFVSNLPEALGASNGMRDGGHSTRRVYLIWWGIAVISAVCAAIGYGVVEAIPGIDGSYVEAFAAGAVLTMLADSMIPEAYRAGRKATGLLTVLGFAVAGALSLIE